MRTVLFLLAALLLMAAFFILAKLFAANHPGAPAVALAAFVAIWFAVSAFNMWVGVARAGYSVVEELPIFLLVFGVPAAVAVAAKWKLL
jgi:hypothetical protein